jgi:hypothetical protein
MSALLTALNPFLIWYAQDARAYALLTALVVAAIWQTWLGARRNRVHHWLAAGALWWLALFTHYFAVLPFVTTGLSFVLAPETRRRWRGGAALFAGVGLTFLPWALYIAPAFAGHTKGWITSLGFADAALQVLSTFSAGVTSGLWVSRIGAFTLGLSAILGWLIALRRHWGKALWLFAAGLAVPLALWCLSLVRPAFTAHYAIAGVPGALISAAMGICSLQILQPRWRWVQGWLASGLMLVALSASTHYFYDTAYAKAPDMRRLMRYLSETALEGEVILRNVPDPVFYYYYQGPAPVETSPPAPIALVGAEAAGAHLRSLTDRFRHIRFFPELNPGYDPDGFAGRWLLACCELITETRVSGLTVQAFDTPLGSLAARRAYTAEFSGGLTLTGYRIINATPLNGEWVHLTLYWTTREPVANSYTVFVHFIAPDGFVTADADGLPRNGAYPTNQWKVGEDVIDPHRIFIPDGAAPAEYHIEIGLYRAETGERLMLDSQSSDLVRLPEAVHVTPALGAP